LGRAEDSGLFYIRSNKVDNFSNFLRENQLQGGSGAFLDRLYGMCHVDLAKVWRCNRVSSRYKINLCDNFLKISKLICLLGSRNEFVRQPFELRHQTSYIRYIHTNIFSL
jgi:hypothetical protein